MTPSTRWSFIGSSDKKKVAMVLSMNLHIKYIRSLEDSDRVRKACVTYLQNWYQCFYPERPDLMAELQALAEELEGHLDPPRLGWKYAWMQPIAGRKVAKYAQTMLPQLKASVLRHWDKVMYQLESRTRQAEPSNTANEHN